MVKCQDVLFGKLSKEFSKVTATNLFLRCNYLINKLQKNIQEY